MDDDPDTDDPVAVDTVIPPGLMKEEERDTLGFRVGGPDKGREDDVSATFQSLAEYKFYPNREPSRVPVHGDLLDNMLCPSTEQVMLVEEVAKKSGKRIKTYNELTKKHDMNEMGYSKKDKHTAYKPPPPKRTKKTTKKTTPTKEPTKSPSKKTPKKSPSKLNRGNAFLYGPFSSSLPSDTPSISPPASPPAKKKYIIDRRPAAASCQEFISFFTVFAFVISLTQIH